MFLRSAFLVGFLGSFHCAGMCGPIALALPLDHLAVARVQRRRQWPLLTRLPDGEKTQRTHRRRSDVQRVSLRVLRNPATARHNRNLPCRLCRQNRSAKRSCHSPFRPCISHTAGSNRIERERPVVFDKVAIHIQYKIRIV